MESMHHRIVRPHASFVQLELDIRRIKAIDVGVGTRWPDDHHVVRKRGPVRSRILLYLIGKSSVAGRMAGSIFERYLSLHLGVTFGRHSEVHVPNGMKLK